MTDSPHNLSRLLQLQLLIARAGQRDSLQWWDDESLSAHAAHIMERVFAGEPPVSAQRVALRAALSRHAAALGHAHTATHLFRLDTRRQTELAMRGLRVPPDFDARSPIPDMATLQARLLAILQAPPAYDLEGWRSYFGVPFKAKDLQGVEDWIFFGCEEVVKHETRGAIPIMRGYCMPSTVHAHKMLVEILEAIRDKLLKTNEANEFEIREEAEPLLRRGYIQSEAESHKAHIPIERFILKRAMDSYARGENFLFRTLLLSESQIPQAPADFLVAYRQVSNFDIPLKTTEMLGQLSKRIGKAMQNFLKGLE